MTNDFQTAGRILGAIRRSESAAKSAEVAAWKRHQERCEKLLAGVSPVVRKLIETHREAERGAVREAARDDVQATIAEATAIVERADDACRAAGGNPLAAIAPSLLKEPEPMTGAVVIDRSVRGKR